MSINGDVQIKFTKDLSYRGTVGIRKRTINTDVFIQKDLSKQRMQVLLMVGRRLKSNKTSCTIM